MRRGKRQREIDLIDTIVGDKGKQWPASFGTLQVLRRTSSVSIQDIFITSNKFTIFKVCLAQRVFSLHILLSDLV